MKTYSSAWKEEKQKYIACPLCSTNNFSSHFACGGFAFVRCKKCALVQQNPQPEQKEVLARYGKDYLEYELKNEDVYRDLELMALRSVDFFTEKAKGQRLLDIGSASGCLLEHLKNLGYLAEGLEICKETALYAQSKRGLTVSTLTLEETHYEDASFDIVHASHLIEHLNDPDSFIKECYRILKPLGKLYLTTPNIESLQAFLFKSEWRSAINDHLFLFGKSSLRALLNKNNFTVKKCRTWGGLARGLKPAWAKGFLDKAVKPLGVGDVMILVAVKEV